MRPWCVRFHQDIDGLANAFSNIIFKYLMVSCYRSVEWWEAKCKGIKYVSQFTATRAGSDSGSYVVHVFSTLAATATPVAAAADTAALALASAAAATAPTEGAAHTAAASLLNPGGGGGGREGGGSPDAAPQPTVLAQPDNAVVAAAAPSQTYELRQPRSVPGQKQPRIGRAYQAELPHFQPSSVQDQLWVPNEVHTLLKQHDLILSTFTSGSPTPKRIPGGSSSTEQERTRDSNPQPCVC